MKGDGYISIVLKQFKKRQSARISLFIIIFLMAIAVFAPFLANNKPIILYSTYGEYFKYFFGGFEKTKNNYIENLKMQDTLSIQKSSKLKEYDKIKSTIHNLNKENDSYGNKYEALKEKIDVLSKSSAKASQKKVKVLKQERQEIGSKQNEIKARMLTLQTKRENVSISLLQLSSKLEFEKNAKLIIKNIDNMLFTLNYNVRKSLYPIKEDYEALFTSNNYGMGLAGEGLGEYIKSINKLSYELSNIIMSAKRGGESLGEESYLAMRVSFPVLNDLDFIDILLISLFIASIKYPFIFVMGKKASFLGLRKSISNKGRFLVYVTLVLIIGSFLYVLKDDNKIPTNYKQLLVSHFESESLSTKSSKRTNAFAIFPPVSFGFNESIIEEKLQKPAILDAGINAFERRHIFGTDDTGRDVLARIIWGARISLSVGFVAVLIYVTIGIILGSIAGYFGGLVDLLLSRFIEIVICFPAFFLILTIIAFVGPSITNIMIIIGLTSWPGIARLVRGEFLRLRNEDFVVSAKALGASDLKIIFKYILPNSLTPVLVSATFGIASSMLIEAGLSFLGFGVREPFPSWGMMISSGQGDVLNYWWLSLIPGIAIFISVTSYNLLGDALREALDPKMKSL